MHKHEPIGGVIVMNIPATLFLVTSLGGGDMNRARDGCSDLYRFSNVHFLI